MLGMSLLEIPAAYFRTRNLRGDRQDGHAAAMAIIKAINQMQISRPTTAGADGQFPGQMRFGTGRKGCRFFMAHVNPMDILSRADRVGNAVQRISGNAVYPLNSCLHKNFHKKIRYILGHKLNSSLKASV